MQDFDLKLCSVKTPQHCSNFQIQSNIVLHTAYIIIIGALVTSFSFLFANILLNLIVFIFGENLFITMGISLIMLLIVIVILFRVEKRAGKWLKIAEERKINV